MGAPSPITKTILTPLRHWAGTAFLSQNKRCSENRSVCKMPWHAQSGICTPLLMGSCLLWQWLVKHRRQRAADQGLVSRKIRNFWVGINPFVSSTRMGFKLWNLAVILPLFICETYLKSNFSRSLDHSFKNWFSSPLSYRDARETAPRGEWGRKLCCL